MGASSFNEMELDAIGEIMNISLGASATAVSTMLGTKVNITTPVVLVQRKDEFEFKRLEPAIGVEIDYVEGLEGKNIMMFRKEDIRIIVSTMMGGDIPEAEFEMDELYISAICEVMNQMMGSSATALSEFLGTIVNISTPKSFEIGEPEEFKNKYFIEADGMVVVRFRLEIEDKLNSEFMNIMPTKLAKRLLEPFADSLGLTKEPEHPQNRYSRPRNPSRLWFRNLSLQYKQQNPSQYRHQSPSQYLWLRLCHNRNQHRNLSQCHRWSIHRCRQLRSRECSSHIIHILLQEWIL